MTMPSDVDIRALQVSWMADPSWNIEETEGFEPVAEFLRQWRLDKEAEWDQVRRRNEDAYCRELQTIEDCARRFWEQEKRIRALEQEIIRLRQGDQ